MRARSCTVVLALAAATLAAGPARADVTAAGSLRLAPIGVFSSPTYATSPPGDPSRLIVVQKGGTIRIVRDGVLLPAPFLTVDWLTGNRRTAVRHFRAASRPGPAQRGGSGALARFSWAQCG